MKASEWRKKYFEPYQAEQSTAETTETAADSFRARMKAKGFEMPKPQKVETVKPSAPAKKAEKPAWTIETIDKRLEALGKYTPAMGDPNAMAKQQKNHAEAAKLKALRGQLEQEAYTAKGQEALGKLSKKQRKGLGKLLEKPSAPALEMQGVVDNRSWEDRYVEEQLEQEKLRNNLRATGMTDEEIHQNLAYLSREQNRAKYEEETEKAREYAKEHPVLGSIKSVGQQVTAPLAAMDMLAQSTGDQPVDPYRPESMMLHKSRATREQVSEGIESPVGRFLYSTGMSMADSAVVAAMTAAGVPPAMGATMLGSAAAVDAGIAAKERGADDTSALLTGVAAGIAESFFEKYSIESLFKLKPLEGELRKRVLTGVKNLGKQTLTEGSEEVFTTIANTITDDIINRDLSDFSQSVADKVTAGMSYQAAQDETLKEWAVGLGLDFAGGALAGGLMAGGEMAISEQANNWMARQSLRPYQDELMAAAEEVAPDAGHTKRARQTIEQGKKLSGSRLRGLYGEADAAVAQRNQESDAKTAAAVETQLKTLGETGDIPTIARAVVAARNGDKSAELSEAGKTVLEDLRTGAEWTRGLPQRTNIMDHLREVRGRQVNPNATDKREVTGAKYNAKTGRMDALVKKEGGGVEAVPMDSASVTQRQQELAEYASEYGEEGSTMMAAIQPDQNPADYAADWAMVYAYGQTGTSMSYALSDKRGGILTKDQRRIAYEAGQRAAGAFDAPKSKPQTNRPNRHKSGTVSLKGATVDGVRYRAVNETALTEKQKASVDAMTTFAKATGVNVVFFESELVNGKRTQANGLYKNGTVYLDIAAGARGEDLADVAVLRTAGHELTHFIQQFNEDDYVAVRSFILNHLAESKQADLETLIRRKIAAQPELNREEAMDEVTADACEMMLRDTKILDELAKNEKSLAQKIKRWVLDWIDRVKKAFQGVEARSAEARAMMDKLTELQEMWDKALTGAVQNLQTNEISDELETTDEVEPVEDTTQYSYRSLAEAAGFVGVQYPDGTRGFERDGQKVTEVTVDDIDNSPIGAMINYSVDKKDITAEEADRQRKMFADVCNMAIQTNDFSMTMQFMGSAIFTGMKANSDPQYGTTYDFPSICTKTQAMIDTMSARMVKKGRGLRDGEILQLYRGVFASGNPVPCPECYVFSRWIGIGGLLQNIKDYQERYKNMTPAQVEEIYQETRARVNNMVEEVNEAARKAGKAPTLTFGRGRGKIQNELQKKYDDTVDKISKAEQAGNKVSQADLARVEAIKPMLDDVKALTWIDKVYFADRGHTKRRADAIVPDEILFDLNRGETFAQNYKAAWGFRTTQGAGYGKAITPYAEARIGEGIYVTKSTSKTIKDKASGELYSEKNKPATRNVFVEQRHKLTDEARTQLDRARIKQKTQAFIGGQRFQSTSDARFENASDYLIAALEMQAMHGMVQVYTKVDGAVPTFAKWGFSINQSLMPYGNGLDDNGNPKDTTTGGMKPAVAIANREKYDSAGTITIGVNDRHIRAMLPQWIRDFIIPYHASGGKVELVKTMRAIQDGEYGKTAKERATAIPSADYTREQSEKILSDEVLSWRGKTAEEIALIKKRRDCRIALLTNGRAGKKDEAVIRGSKYLSRLQERLQGEWSGVQLTRKVVEGQIFPNEYWDFSLSYDESGKITEEYLEYCEELGFLHKFSGTVPRNGKLVPIKGWNEKGEREPMEDLAYIYENGQKTDKVEPFFWKVLTDRRMYDNERNYLPQKYVKLSDTKTEDITEFAKFNVGRQYNQELSQETLAKLAELKDEAALSKAVDKLEEETGRALPKGARYSTRQESETMAEDSQREAYRALGKAQFSQRVQDPETLEFLNNQGTITTYKTMQLIDGKLYPPMAALVDGNLEDYSVLGAWEQAVEHPELVDKNGNFKLKKGKGDSGTPAKYNPYMHSSNSVLNDQFTGAYKRPNLVTVECEVPVSEATSGYHAEKAKDSTGWLAWHSGTVAAKVRKQKGIERKAFLSRWIKPVRILDNEEVAKRYKELLSGTKIEVPDNVVPPALLEALKKEGIRIKKSGKLEEWEESQKAKKSVRDSYTTEDYAQLTEELEAMRQILDEATQRSRELDQNEELQEAMRKVRSLPLRSPERKEARAAYNALKEKLGTSEAYDAAERARKAYYRKREEVDAAKEYLGRERERKAIEASGLTAEEYFREKAVKHFGLIRGFRAAGYLLPDGRLLNFSGGTDDGSRGYDHRDIAIIYEETHQTEALNRFLADGNIRIMDESPGVDIPENVEPTVEQYDMIKRMVREHQKDGFFSVDFSTENGRNAGNYSYTGRLNPEKVVNDIKYFFKTGSTRAQSELAAFYSQRTDPITDREILSYALEDTAKNEEERQELAAYRQAAAKLRRYEEKLTYAREALRKHKDGTQVLSKEQYNLESQRAQRYQTAVDRDTPLLENLLNRSLSLQELLKRERENIEQTIRAGHVDRARRYGGSFEARLDAAAARELSMERRYQEALWKNAEDHDQRIKDKKREQQTRRNAEDRVLKKTIEGKAERLRKMLVTNTDKAHIPEDLKEPLGAFLETLDFTSKTALATGTMNKMDARYAERLEALRNAIADHTRGMQGENEELDVAGYLDLPQGFTDRLSEHINAAKQILADRAPGESVINRMSREELQNLDMVLSVLNHAVKGINELMANRRFGQVEKAAEQTMRYMETKPQASGGKVDTFLNWTNTLPVYAFERLGKGAQSIFEALQDGWDQLARNIAKAKEVTSTIYTPEEAKKWSEELQTLELYDADEGEVVEVQLTTAQLMSIYLLASRPQAVMHIIGGGIRPEDITIPGKKTIRQAKHYSMTELDLERIVQNLSKRQRQVARALQQIMEHQGSEWGNEISMKRHGYKFFGEKNYFPIETDRDDRIEKGAESGDDGSMYRLLDLSATKPLQQHASNALIVRNVFDVYTNHMADMAKYNALALPVLDALKWYNYKTQMPDSKNALHRRTLKRSIENVYGTAAKRYIVQFMKDVNGIHESGDRGDTLAKKLLSNYKRAAVAANLRVALLQPTSYVRAAYVLPSEYLVKALKKKGSLKGDITQMLNYSGIGRWKDMGYFDTDVGRSMRDQIKGTETKLDKLVEATMIGAEKGDQWTWGLLWRATRMEQEAKGLGGIKLMEATADRFREMVYKTQVIDSTMTRSHMMRSTTLWSKMATAFMSEPTVSYNMLENVLQKVTEDAKGMPMKQAVRKHGKQLALAGEVYVASSIAAAAVEAIADSLRDDEDDPFWKKWLAKFVGWDGNLWSDLNPLAKLPTVKDIQSMLDGFDVGRTDMESFQTAVQAYQIWKEKLMLATGLQEKPTAVTWHGNMTTYGALYKTAQAFSQLAGIPLSSASREIQTAWNNTVGLVWPSLKLRTYEDKAAAEAKRAQDAILDGGKKLDKVREELEEDLIEAGASPREATSGANRKLKAAVQGLYVEGRITEREAAKHLREDVGVKDKDVTPTIKKWNCELDTGIKYDKLRTAYERGEISRTELISARMEYGGETREEATAKVNAYDWDTAHPELSDMSDSKVSRYDEIAGPAGISPEIYYKAVQDASEMEADRDSAGKIIKGKKEKVVEYIQSLSINYSQQRAMWEALKSGSWSDKDTPWE